MKTKYDIGEGELVLIPAEVRIIEVTPDSTTYRVPLLKSNDPILMLAIRSSQVNLFPKENLITRFLRQANQDPS